MKTVQCILVSFMLRALYIDCAPILRNDLDETIWNCDFETSTMCDFTGVSTNEAWTVGMASSITMPGTGPSSGYGDIGGVGAFAYTDGSSYLNAPFGMQLHFGYPFTGTGISFAYSMYGKDIGVLQFQTSIDGTNFTSIWQTSGNLGESWGYVEALDITNNPLSIRFVSVFLIFFVFSLPLFSFKSMMSCYLHICTF